MITVFVAVAGAIMLGEIAGDAVVKLVAKEEK